MPELVGESTIHVVSKSADGITARKHSDLAMKYSPSGGEPSTFAAVGNGFLF
jgi:hypothetical protein